MISSSGSSRSRFARTLGFSFAPALTLGLSVGSLFGQTATQPKAAAPAIVAKGTFTAIAQKSKEAPLAVYSHGDPTAEEQYLLELINRARANPPAEGVLLSTTTDPDITNSYTYFGSPSRAKVKSDFATYSPQPPLAFNSDLITAARGHDQDMLTYDYQGHTSHDGTTFDVRIKNSGYTSSYAGENVYAYGTSMFDIHASFLIDFGNDSTLGHRLNILNFIQGGPFYTEIGIGVLHGGTGIPDVGPIITTEDFGDAGKTFILGVVYNDLNGNGMYDPGEGISGVTITASGASFTTVTSTSGGYAIPYPIGSTGNVTVTASGGVLGTGIAKNISFAGQNVKVDFTTAEAGLPTLVTMLTPLADTTINMTSGIFRWNKIAGATAYHIQISTDSTLKTFVVNDSVLTDTTYTLQNLKDGGVYYWRVKAKNTKGWGFYGATQTFAVVLAPNVVTLLSPANGATPDTGTINFSWRSSTPRVTGYWFQLSSSATMTNPVVSDSTLTDTTDQVLSSLLQAGKTYYWTVRAENDGGWNGAGTPRSFTTSTLSVATNNQVIARSIVSPNPSSGATHIIFGLDKPEDVSLKIFSITGELVQTLVSGKLAAGMQDLRWDVTAKPSGVYFYQLRVGSTLETGRIVVAH